MPDARSLHRNSTEPYGLAAPAAPCKANTPVSPTITARCSLRISHLSQFVERSKLKDAQQRLEFHLFDMKFCD
jgi:hypothetical protein